MTKTDINQLSKELYGKNYQDLKPQQQNSFWKEYYRRLKAVKTFQNRAKQGEFAAKRKIN